MIYQLEMVAKSRKKLPIHLKKWRSKFVSRLLPSSKPKWRPHSGQTTGHARYLPTSGDFWSLSPFITQNLSTVNLLHWSHLGPIILPLQTFFCRVLLLRQQAFSSGNLPPERPTTTTTAIKTQVFVFCCERVNSTRKFTIVAEIVSRGKRYIKETPLLELCLK